MPLDLVTSGSFDWPRWASVAYGVVATVAIVLTVIDVGQGLGQLALAGLIVVVFWTGSLHPSADLNTARVVVLVGACILLATDPGSEVLFVVCMACAELAIEIPVKKSAPVVGFAVAAVVVRALTVGPRFHPIEYFPWPIAFVGSWVGGLFFSSQSRLNAELRANQTNVASQAAADERRRLAREIHDVIAHSMTVTMLHVSGARLALQDSPPSVDDAIEALLEAEKQGRQSLADIRRTVGLLTVEDESQLEAPLPDTADLAGLIKSFADAGQPVTFTVAGDLAAVPASTGLAVFRVVQEGLANAAKHAPGAPVSVDIQVVCGAPMSGGRRVDVHVTNAEPTEPVAVAVPGGGRGLPGMIERVEALGGRLTAGPRRGGWEVSARLPLPTGS
jgi:signal transduction histidine kinase